MSQRQRRDASFVDFDVLRLLSLSRVTRLSTPEAAKVESPARRRAASRDAA
jgi:hypothetical protein